MDIRFNIPVLQQEQTWKRNEDIKNWGNYIPLFFKKGKPTYILPNHLFIFTQIFYHFVLITLLIYDYIKQPSHQIVVLIIRSILFFVNVLLLFSLVKIDPGISSSGDPIINQQELSGYKNFCMECKCMQNQSIRHCNYCNVCIRDAYAHINITNMCITKQNYRIFGILCISTALQTLLIL